jgi:two-component system, NarL family, response regulator NreC
MPMRTVLIDAHEVTRAGFRFLLQRDGRGTVVGEAADAQSGYSVVERERPDVTVVDLRLRDEDGIAVTRELRRRAPRLRVLVIGSLMRVDEALEALYAGAGGVAVKHESGDALVEALLAVGRGETYLTPELPFADEAARRAGLPNATPLAVLSNRERDICDRFLRGLTNQQISERLFISVKTVETHRAHIFRKLGVHSMAELMRFAARHAILPRDD